MLNYMEIWKDIKDYPNYQVSSEGRVKSLGNNKTRKEKILNGCNNGDGYLRVNLCKDGKRKLFYVHRLVAQAFLDNPNNLPEINHIDEEDKTNNCVSNLEWCDRKYNINYGTRTERFIKSKSIPILQFSKTGDFIRKWNSAKEASRVLGINQNHIPSCCKGKRKSSYGYVWMYATINGFEIDINKLKKVAA